MNLWPFIIGATLLGVITIWIRTHRRLRCDCGNPWMFFQPHHERVTVMVAFFAYELLATIWCAGAGWRAAAIIWLLATWSDGYRIWKHEKGRRDRAAKAVGRVVTDLHGRLKVVPA